MSFRPNTPLPMKEWLDLGGSGYEVLVASFREGEDKAVIIRGPDPVSAPQAEGLRALGFSPVDGLIGLWGRPGETFSKSELSGIFPLSRTVTRPVASTRVLVQGTSPFAAARGAARPAVIVPGRGGRPVVRPAPGAAAPEEQRRPEVSAATTVPTVPPARPGFVPPGFRRPAVVPAASDQPSDPAASIQAETRAPAALPPVEAPAKPGFVRKVPGLAKGPIGQDTTRLPAVASIDSLPDIDLEDRIFSDHEPVNPFQVRYRPRSKIGTPIAMVPVEMAEALEIAFDRLEQKVGEIDSFVAERLGWVIDDLERYLSPEQVDAVALTISGADDGRGLILADQTGLGKGRVLAAVALAQVRQGKRVVFITEKGNLFSDFWRDIRDIGAESAFGTPFLLNDDAVIVDTSGQTSGPLFPAMKKADRARVVKDKALPKGTRLVLSTYSQHNRKGSPKNEFLVAVAKGAFAICDESHNAVGDSNTSMSIGEALAEADGAMYSSATFARGAANLAAYAPVLPQSIRSLDLAATMKAGGPGMAEVLSQMLAEEGVLLRREQDLSRITIEIISDDRYQRRNEAYMNALSPVLQKMAAISLAVNELVEDLNSDVDENGNPIRQKGPRKTYTTANFGNSLSVLMRQFFSALNVGLTVEHALGALDRGIKPVVVIDQTMEALMRELSADDGAAVIEEDDGDVKRQRPPTFAEALGVVLGRLTTMRMRQKGEDPVDIEIDHPGILTMKDEVAGLIALYPDLSIATIDDIRAGIEASGEWKADEISARGMRVVDGVYTSMGKRDRNAIIADFNSGGLDAVVVTRAGSTGLSLHASEKVKDQRQRIMIEHQIAQNVVERVQFWGRVNRRGQVSEPLFAVATTGLSAEVRNLAMQNRKVEELSANVTGSSAAATAMDVPDMLDPLGNECAKSLLDERPALADRMVIPMRVDRDKAEEELYYINKLMMRLPLLGVAEQDRLFADLQALYEDRSRDMIARGQSPRRVREVDGIWSVRRRQLFNAGHDDDGDVFGRPIYLSIIEAQRDRRPISSEHIVRQVISARDALEAKGLSTGRGGHFGKVIATVRSDKDKILEASLPRRYESVREALESDDGNAVKNASKRLSGLFDVLSEISPGAVISAPDDDGQTGTGIIVDIRVPDEDEWHLPGNWVVRYAFPADEKLREISIATIIREKAFLVHREKDGFNENRLKLEASRFDQVPSGQVPEFRRVLEGNLFSAALLVSGKGYGSITAFTDDRGMRRRGVLVPRSKTNAVQNLPCVTRKGWVARDIVEIGGRVSVGPDRPGESMDIEISGRDIRITAPGGRQAEKVLLTPDLVEVTGNFTNDQVVRSCKFPVERLPRVMDVLAGRGHIFRYDGQYRARALQAELASQQALAPGR